eukprot:jgi/Mesvir1/27101/Mv20783-RA.1
MAEPATDASVAQLQETITRLQHELTAEKKKSASLVEELRKVKEASLNIQMQVEQEEEFITNKLVKRLGELKNEKQALANEVEQEEEFLTNTLQKRLEKLNQEKADLENRLEAEQEYIVNKLQKQLGQLSEEKAKLNREKVDLENQLEAEQEYIVNKLQQQVEDIGREKAKLTKEKALLEKHVTELARDKRKLNREKVDLENSLEQEEEFIVNRMQTQIDELVARNRYLERQLESADVHFTPRHSDDEEGHSHDGSHPNSARSHTHPIGGRSPYPWEENVAHGVPMARRSPVQMDPNYAILGHSQSLGGGRVVPTWERERRSSGETRGMPSQDAVRQARELRKQVEEMKLAAECSAKKASPTL